MYFRPAQDEPVRIEFFGDEIESIRRFDPATQRSTHKLTECVLQPLTEFQKSRAVLAELAEHMRERGAARAGSSRRWRGVRGLGNAGCRRCSRMEATILDFFRHPSS